MATTGIALVKRRDRYRKLIGVFPDRQDFYTQQIEELDAQIHEMSVCRRCGRPLKDEEARAIGYGKECLAKAEEAEESV